MDSGIKHAPAHRDDNGNDKNDGQQFFDRKYKTRKNTADRRSERSGCNPCNDENTGNTYKGRILFQDHHQDNEKNKHQIYKVNGSQINAHFHCPLLDAAYGEGKKWVTVTIRVLIAILSA